MLLLLFNRLNLFFEFCNSQVSKEVESEKNEKDADCRAVGLVKSHHCDEENDEANNDDKQHCKPRSFSEPAHL